MTQPEKTKRVSVPTEFYEHEKQLISVSNSHNRILQLGSVGLVASGVGAIAYGITQRDPLGVLGVFAGAAGAALFNEAAKDIKRGQEWLESVESRPANYLPIED